MARTPLKEEITMVKAGGAETPEECATCVSTKEKRKAQAERMLQSKERLIH